MRQRVPEDNPPSASQAPKSLAGRYSPEPLGGGGPSSAAPLVVLCGGLHQHTSHHDSKAPLTRARARTCARWQHPRGGLNCRLAAPLTKRRGRASAETPTREPLVNPWQRPRCEHAHRVDAMRAGSPRRDHPSSSKLALRSQTTRLSPVLRVFSSCSHRSHLLTRAPGLLSSSHPCSGSFLIISGASAARAPSRSNCAPTVASAPQSTSRVCCT